MFKKEKKKELDMPKVNESISLLSRILKISYIIIIVIGIYALTLVFKEWGIFSFFKNILKILTPFFIGLIIAWLFNPLICYLQNHKINRVIGTILVYIVFLGILYLLISAIVPLLADQINTIVGKVPLIIEDIGSWMDRLFNTINDGTNVDIIAFKNEIFSSITDFGKNITNNLPELTVKFVKSFFSGIGVFGLGLIIGFYMLFNFDNVNSTLISFLPKKIRNKAKDLMGQINDTLLNFVQGTLMISTIIFVTNYIGFLIIGVEAPLLFALFCGITNIIPYAGPYIGGIPVALVALSQNTTMGIFVIIYIAGIQMLEGNILQPLVMGKTMKLHPVTILISLLIFGHFFGIIGMIIATPIVATFKTIFLFFDQKYEFMKYHEE